MELYLLMGTSTLTGLVTAHALPDAAQLFGQLYVVDGVNPNMVVVGNTRDTRPMGCLGQTALAATAIEGEVLQGNVVYTYAVRRVLTQGTREIDSAYITDQILIGWYSYECGAAGTTTIGDWTAIADAEFAVTLGGTGVDVTGIDFSAATNMTDVAALIQTALRSATGDAAAVVVYTAGTTAFTFKASDGRVSAIGAVSGGAGTDISGAGFLNASGGTETQDGKAQLTLEDYPVEVPSWCSLTYKVYRSTEGSGTVLYLIDELTQTEYDALSSGVWVDTTDDASVDTGSGDTIDTSNDAVTAALPTVRYIAAWKGSLVAGGSEPYSAGSVTGSSGSDQLTFNSPAALSLYDVGAYVGIEGEPRTFVIEAVDEGTGVATLDRNLTQAVTAGEYVRFRDRDTVYITQTVPENPELYNVSTGTIVSTQGDGSPITGIAVHGGLGYIMRRERVEVLDGTPTNAAIQPHPQNPPGCRGHQTIADRMCPMLIYYAGESGVWAISGYSARHLSGPMDTVIRDLVDHAMDEYCHAVYDQASGCYWLWLFARDWEARLGVRVPDLTLIYDTRRDSWAIARIAASTSGLWRATDGRIVPVLGIAGGVAQLGIGDYDGAEVSGTVTAGAVGSLTDSAASFDTDGAGLAGLPVWLYDSAGNVRQRLVARNTADTLFFSADLGTAPSVGDRYRVGSIPTAVRTPRVMPDGGVEEKLSEVYVVHDQAAASTPGKVTLKRAFPDANAADGTTEPTLAFDLVTMCSHRFGAALTGVRDRAPAVSVTTERAPVALHEIGLMMVGVKR